MPLITIIDSTLSLIVLGSILFFGGPNSHVKSNIQGVTVTVTAVSPNMGSLHWKITNNSEVEVYVYDVFLWGTAFGINTKPDTVVFETSPTKIENGFPNHVLPVLLLLIPAHADREGDFKDPEIGKCQGKKISLE
nr:hypothetical protein [Acidobacteriota bacterium]